MAAQIAGVRLQIDGLHHISIEGVVGLCKRTIGQIRVSSRRVTLTKGTLCIKRA